MASLTQERLLNVLSYNAETGAFTWRSPPLRRPQLKGVAAGKRQNGYIRIKIDRRLYPAHRLAWLYMTGEWPVSAIDHIDAVRSNNAWANLRLASSSQNAANRSTPSTNTSGFKGVVWNKSSNKWQVIVRFGGKAHYLGLFEDARVAKAAYDAKQLDLAGAFARSA